MKRFEFLLSEEIAEGAMNDFIRGINSLKGDEAATIETITIRRIVTDRPDVAAILDTVATRVGAVEDRKRIVKPKKKISAGPEPSGLAPFSEEK